MKVAPPSLWDKCRRRLNVRGDSSYLGVDRMYAGDYDAETFGARLGLRPVKELS